MRERPFNVLFLCTHNSARSIMAECILNHLGRGRFKGLSAGSRPSGVVNPYALELLERLNYDVSGVSSKSWEVFSGAEAPPLDFVFTVCDDAANETCPVWPGQPMSAHWGLPDPSRVKGGEAVKRQAFTDAHRMLYQRISIFVSLPFDALDALSLRARLDEIGGLERVPPKEPA